MKQLAMACIALLALFSCNDANNEKKDNDNAAKAESKGKGAAYPYEVELSSDFSIGNQDRAATVLNLWKDFDNNNLANGVGSFADTVTVEFTGMNSMQLSRDSLLAMTIAYRNTYDSVWSSVTAITTLKDNTNNVESVLVWGREIAMMKNGKRDTTDLHEIWGFDAQGKIDYMRQYADKIR